MLFDSLSMRIRDCLGAYYRSSPVFFPCLRVALGFRALIYFFVAIEGFLDLISGRVMLVEE